MLHIHEVVLSVKGQRLSDIVIITNIICVGHNRQVPKIILHLIHSSTKPALTLTKNTNANL